MMSNVHPWLIAPVNAGIQKVRKNKIRMVPCLVVRDAQWRLLMKIHGRPVGPWEEQTGLPGHKVLIAVQIRAGTFVRVGAFPFLGEHHTVD